MEYTEHFIKKTTYNGLGILVTRFYTWIHKTTRLVKDNKSWLYFSCIRNRILSVSRLVQAWTLLVVLSSGLARKPTGNVAIASSTILQRIPYSSQEFRIPTLRRKYFANSIVSYLLFAFRIQKLLLYSDRHNLMYISPAKLFSILHHNTNRYNLSINWGKLLFHL